MSMYRRRFFRAAGGAGLAAAAMAAPAITVPALGATEPTNAAPRPVPAIGLGAIPGRIWLNSNNPVTGKPFEPSSIFDFRGVAGVTNVLGSGTARDALGSRKMYTNSDMRFMVGDYVAVDGKLRHGAFGFV